MSRYVNDAAIIVAALGRSSKFADLQSVGWKSKDFPAALWNGSERRNYTTGGRIIASSKASLEFSRSRDSCERSTNSEAYDVINSRIGFRVIQFFITLESEFALASVLGAATNSYFNFIYNFEHLQ